MHGDVYQCVTMNEMRFRIVNMVKMIYLALTVYQYTDKINKIPYFGHINFVQCYSSFNSVLT